MLAVTLPGAGYAEHLTAWSNALAAGQIGPLANCLAEPATFRDVNRYLANAIGERERLLQEELSLTALAFIDFQRLIEAYIATTPRTTFELDTNDAARCLQWLRETQLLTAQQQDFITYQECEYACYRQAQRQRASYLRFEARPRLSNAADAQAAIVAGATLHLAPVRVTAKLAAPSLLTTANSACDVVFFALAAQVQTLCLASGVLQQLRTLADGEPGTFDALRSRNMSVDRAALLATVVAWTTAGLVACEGPATASGDT